MLTHMLSLSSAARNCANERIYIRPDLEQDELEKTYAKNEVKKKVEIDDDVG